MVSVGDVTDESLYTARLQSFSVFVLILLYICGHQTPHRIECRHESPPVFPVFNSFCLFKAASFVRLLPVLAACHISFVDYIGK